MSGASRQGWGGQDRCSGGEGSGDGQRVGSGDLRHRPSNAARLRGFAASAAAQGATVYTDDHKGYLGIPHPHETVRHSVSEYVSGMAHTNGIESFWALLKRGYHGTFHHISPKHLQRYVAEFATRHNLRPQDTATMMGETVARMSGKPLTYAGLVGPVPLRTLAIPDGESWQREESA